MSKARKAALDWLPKRKDDRKRCYQCNDDDIRSIYAKGYRKAEKDLELTLEDICAIDNLLWDLSVEHSKNHSSNEVYYKEVLKRFKDFKERKKK